MSEMKLLVAFDVETGGLWAGRDALLSVAAVAESGEEFHRLIWPVEGMGMNPEALRVNGYSRERWMAGGAVSLLQAGQELALWLDWVRARRGLPVDGVTPVAHNAGFDRGFVAHLEGMCGVHFGLDRRWECSQATLGALRRAGVLEVGSASLDGLCEAVGITGRPAVHEALWDARACLQGYMGMLGLMQAMAELWRQRVKRERGDEVAAGMAGMRWLESGFDDPGVVRGTTDGGTTDGH